MPGRLHVLTAVLVVATMVALGEIIVLVFEPTEYLAPRYKFSPEYGMVLFEKVVMEHAVPRKYKFHYTINEDGYRGRALAQSLDDSLGVVVVLGDSYSFGMGVDDGREYPTVMNRRLRGRAIVVNLACPGWGLTQQVRRYYDFSARHRPVAAVLQFCANDPEDNLINRVATVENGGIVFHNSEFAAHRLKKFLSRSFLQRSQLYNFFRGILARAAQVWFARRQQMRMTPGGEPTDIAGAAVPAMDAFYAELLEAFASRLLAERTTLVMISVDGQLYSRPHIRAAVDRLDAQGALVYLEVRDWLRGLEPYASPEGHVWGERAHAVIGEHLASFVDNEVLGTASTRGVGSD